MRGRETVRECGRERERERNARYKATARYQVEIISNRLSSQINVMYVLWTKCTYLLHAVPQAIFSSA